MQNDSGRARASHLLRGDDIAHTKHSLILLLHHAVMRARPECPGVLTLRCLDEQGELHAAQRRAPARSARSTLAFFDVKLANLDGRGRTNENRGRSNTQEASFRKLNEETGRIKDVPRGTHMRSTSCA